MWLLHSLTQTLPFGSLRFPNKSSSSPWFLSLALPWAASSRPLFMQRAPARWESPGAPCERGLHSRETFELTLELWLLKALGDIRIPWKIY